MIYAVCSHCPPQYVNYLLYQYLSRVTRFLTMWYSKTCLKRPLKRRQKKSFQDLWSLNAGKKYCRMLLWSILQYFWLALRYQMAFRPLFCLFLSGRLRHVSLCLHSVWSEPLLVVWIFYKGSSSESTFVKLQHCWKSHVMAHIILCFHADISSFLSLSVLSRFIIPFLSHMYCLSLSTVSQFMLLLFVFLSFTSSEFPLSHFCFLCLYYHLYFLCSYYHLYFLCSYYHLYFLCLNYHLYFICFYHLVLMSHLLHILLQLF